MSAVPRRAPLREVMPTLSGGEWLMPKRRRATARRPDQGGHALDLLLSSIWRQNQHCRQRFSCLQASILRALRSGSSRSDTSLTRRDESPLTDLATFRAVMLRDGAANRLISRKATAFVGCKLFVHNPTLRDWAQDWGLSLIVTTLDMRSQEKSFVCPLGEAKASFGPGDSEWGALSRHGMPPLRLDRAVESSLTSAAGQGGDCEPEGDQVAAA